MCECAQEDDKNEKTQSKEKKETTTQATDSATSDSSTAYVALPDNFAPIDPFVSTVREADTGWFGFIKILFGSGTSTAETEDARHGLFNSARSTPDYASLHLDRATMHAQEDEKTESKEKAKKKTTTQATDTATSDSSTAYVALPDNFAPIDPFVSTAREANTGWFSFNNNPFGSGTSTAETEDARQGLFNSARSTPDYASLHLDRAIMHAQEDEKTESKEKAKKKTTTQVTDTATSDSSTAYVALPDNFAPIDPFVSTVREADTGWFGFIKILFGSGTSTAETEDARHGLFNSARSTPDYASLHLDRATMHAQEDEKTESKEKAKKKTTTQATDTATSDSSTAYVALPDNFAPIDPFVSTAREANTGWFGFIKILFGSGTSTAETEDARHGLFNSARSTPDYASLHLDRATMHAQEDEKTESKEKAKKKTTTQATDTATSDSSTAYVALPDNFAPIDPFVSTAREANTGWFGFNNNPFGSGTSTAETEDARQGLFNTAKRHSDYASLPLDRATIHGGNTYRAGKDIPIFTNGDTAASSTKAVSVSAQTVTTDKGTGDDLAFTSDWMGVLPYMAGSLFFIFVLQLLYKNRNNISEKLTKTTEILSDFNLKALRTIGSFSLGGFNLRGFSSLTKIGNWKDIGSRPFKSVTSVGKSIGRVFSWSWTGPESGSSSSTRTWGWGRAETSATGISGTTTKSIGRVFSWSWTGPETGSSSSTRTWGWSRAGTSATGIGSTSTTVPPVPGDSGISSGATGTTSTENKGILSDTKTWGGATPENKETSGTKIRESSNTGNSAIVTSIEYTASTGISGIASVSGPAESTKLVEGIDNTSVTEKKGGAPRTKSAGGTVWAADKQRAGEMDKAKVNGETGRSEWSESSQKIKRTAPTQKKDDDTRWPGTAGGEGVIVSGESRVTGRIEGTESTNVSGKAASENTEGSTRPDGTQRLDAYIRRDKNKRIDTTETPRGTDVTERLASTKRQDDTRRPNATEQKESGLMGGADRPVDTGQPSDPGMLGRDKRPDTTRRVDSTRRERTDSELDPWTESSDNPGGAGAKESTKWKDEAERKDKTERRSGTESKQVPRRSSGAEWKVSSEKPGDAGLKKRPSRTSSSELNYTSRRRDVAEFKDKNRMTDGMNWKRGPERSSAVKSKPGGPGGVELNDSPKSTGKAESKDKTRRPGMAEAQKEDPVRPSGAEWKDVSLRPDEAERKAKTRISGIAEAQKKRPGRSNGAEWKDVSGRRGEAESKGSRTGSPGAVEWNDSTENPGRAESKDKYQRPGTADGQKEGPGRSDAIRKDTFGIRSGAEWKDRTGRPGVDEWEDSTERPDWAESKNKTRKQSTAQAHKESTRRPSGAEWKNDSARPSGAEWKHRKGSHIEDEWKQRIGLAGEDEWNDDFEIPGRPEWKSRTHKPNGTEWKDRTERPSDDEWKDRFGRSGEAEWKDASGSSSGAQWEDRTKMRDGVEWKYRTERASEKEWKNYIGRASASEWKGKTRRPDGAEWKDRIKITNAAEWKKGRLISSGAQSKAGTGRQSNIELKNRTERPGRAGSKDVIQRPGATEAQREGPRPSGTKCKDASGRRIGTEWTNKNARPSADEQKYCVCPCILDSKRKWSIEEIDRTQ